MSAQDLVASARLQPVMQRRSNQRRLVSLLARGALEAGHSSLAVQFFTTALASTDMPPHDSLRLGGAVVEAPVESTSPSRGATFGEAQEWAQAKARNGRVLAEERLLRQVILCAAAHHSPRQVPDVGRRVELASAHPSVRVATVCGLILGLRSYARGAHALDYPAHLPHVDTFPGLGVVPCPVLVGYNLTIGPTIDRCQGCVGCVDCIYGRARSAGEFGKLRRVSPGVGDMR